jgi:Fe-S cluster assembly protein SufD
MRIDFQMTERTVIRRKRQVTSDEPGAFPFDELSVRRISTRLKEPKWLLDKRLDAWAAFKATPMPTVKDEPWRRTDIRSLPASQLALREADELPVDEALKQPLAGKTNSGQIVLRPGLPSEDNREPSLKKQGVIFADWASAVSDHADLLQAHLGQLVPASEGWFSALATALGSEGVLLYVPAGVEVSLPLHSILWAPGIQRAFFSRLLVVLEDQAAVTFVHETASPGNAEGPAMHAGVVEAHIGAGSRLQFVEIQNWGENIWNFTHERVRVERNGRLDWIFSAVGSHLTKNFSELVLAGQGAEGRMSGFYIADGVQHFDHDTQQNHLAPNTTSDLLFKGALTGRSRSVWQGMIYVAPLAQKTDGYQANRNLILSREARADSIPGLEILADDVRCTHGATVGQLDEEPLFYLMSRGLPRHEAERLVVDGFFAPIMERIPFEGVRNRLAGMIDDKLG